MTSTDRYLQWSRHKTWRGPGAVHHVPCSLQNLTARDCAAVCMSRFNNKRLLTWSSSYETLDCMAIQKPMLLIVKLSVNHSSEDWVSPVSFAAKYFCDKTGFITPNFIFCKNFLFASQPKFRQMHCIENVGPDNLINLFAAVIEHRSSFGTKCHSDKNKLER